MAEAKVAGILVEDGRQNAIADHRPVKGVKICCAGSFSIALRAPSKSVIVLAGFVVAAYQQRRSKGYGIGGGTKGELHLLACAERDGVSTIGDVEGRQDSGHPLLFLLLDLLFGFFVLAFLQIGRASGTDKRED